MGVDRVDSCKAYLSNPEERIGGSVMWLLCHMFLLDYALHDSKLHGVATWAQHTYWKLVELKDPNWWSSYLRLAKERGWELVLLA